MAEAISVRQLRHTVREALGRLEAAGGSVATVERRAVAPPLVRPLPRRRGVPVADARAVVSGLRSDQGSVGGAGLLVDDGPAGDTVPAH